MFEFLALAQECAPSIAPSTLAAIVNVESSYNPYAIGVVDSQLDKQPKSKAEALEAAHRLEAEGFNFSLGIAQINKHNLPKYGLNYAKAFTPCDNLRAASKILEDCYSRALSINTNEQAALRASLSCYYSGNFVRGFKQEANGQPSYVEKVISRLKPIQPNGNEYAVPSLLSTPAIQITALDIKQQDGNVIAPLASKSAIKLMPEPQNNDITAGVANSETVSKAVVF